MSTNLIAFHGSPETKELYLNRVKAHRAADQLIKGEYWRNGKGCAVGCTIHGSEHSKYETELGIPRLLARLEDGIFEGLANEHAMEWPERFLSAIEPGADLSNVWSQFAIWLLSDETHGVIRFAKTERTKKAIMDVVNAFKKQLEGVKIEVEEWRTIRAAAYADAAAYYAADAAYYADAAAYYAADAAAYYAADADDAAYYAAAADAAAAAFKTKKQEMRKIQADKLVELLQAAPKAQIATA